MKKCDICGKGTYQEIRYGNDSAKFYQVYEYKGKYICKKCARPMSGEKEEEVYINPS